MKQKYPRSYHLYYSEKSTADDKRHKDDAHFTGKHVVGTLKMDGENTTIYSAYIHARSLNSNIDSEDRRWIDALRKAKIEGNIPDTYRICGENLFYQHTCKYDNLESMFYVFSIWDGDTCLPWEETVVWCELLGLKTVPVFYEGVYDKDAILAAFSKYADDENTEGFVIRLSSEYEIGDFSTSLNKYVKKQFVIPSEHWRHSKKTINQVVDGRNPWEIVV